MIKTAIFSILFLCKNTLRLTCITVFGTHGVSYIDIKGNHNLTIVFHNHLIGVSYIDIKGNHNSISAISSFAIGVSYIDIKGNHNKYSLICLSPLV